MAASTPKEKESNKISNDEFVEIVLDDYKLANISRETSLLGRREVLTGKAKFGIFGDGKEVPQIALAKQFRNGDFRSGYYRDQTFMMAIESLTVGQFFAQLYAHTDAEAEPSSAGRSMNGHYGTRSLDENGNWKNLTEMKNSSADVSPTGSQMPRLLGLAQASKFYRENPQLKDFTNFSKGGNEVAFGTIGDASTSEGLFWETVNAAGVLQVPMVLSVWDDGHGISVPIKYQTTKQNISEVLKGFQRDAGKKNGYEIFRVKAWDYPGLCETYEKAVRVARDEHCPVLVHVQECTQPQGHSTSGSHERYKSKERLQWEDEFDCIRKMGEWIIEKGLATNEQLEEIRKEAKKIVRDQKADAWKAFIDPLKQDLADVTNMISQLAENSSNGAFLTPLINELKGLTEPTKKDIVSAARKALRYVRSEDLPEAAALKEWVNEQFSINFDNYSSNLYSETDHSPMKVDEVAAKYPSEPEQVDGRIVLRDNFDKILEKYPEVVIFGEDSGNIGDVNQGLEGLQDKYGEIRVFDTGIREATIVGQGIGLSMRGLRPIAEIQYLDYLLYCLQIMSDDLATVRYRTKAGQMAPLIVRTRGHRLEGIWHSGSPMAMVINGVRGMHVCVPRNQTTAAGFYNTLLQGDDPALIVEPLNAYRSKEPLPTNLGEFTVPLGIPEILSEGTDITMVSYGSTCNLCVEAVQQLQEVGISVELIDVRTLLPFDITGMISESLNKTNRLMIVDEDVPGGASAYILDKIMTDQDGYYNLDSEPVTLSSQPHRPAYGTDGDYFSKPSIEDIFETAYEVMREADPGNFPAIY